MSLLLVVQGVIGRWRDTQYAHTLLPTPHTQTDKPSGSKRGSSLFPMWLKLSAVESLILSSACFCDVCCMCVCVCVCLLSLQWPCSKWMSACLSPSMGPNVADRYFIRPGLSCVHATLKLFLNYPGIKTLDIATDHATLRMVRPNKAVTPHHHLPQNPSTPPWHHPPPPRHHAASDAKMLTHAHT